MEQLTNPRELLKAAEKSRQANFLPPTRKPEQRLNDPDASWGRLSQVTLEEGTLAHNGLSGSSYETALPAIDQLRTRLMLHAGDKNIRKVGISSPMRGSGKTTIVGNLALSLSRRFDIRSLVFDFDLSKPDLIRKFGLEDKGPKFSALEYARRNFDTNCMRIGENVGLSVHSTPYEGTAELLASRKTRQFIETISADFEPDIMLFDMPPLLENDEGMAFLDVLDAVLIVARADDTTVAQIDLAERMVAERTQSLGVILNDCRFPNQP